MKSALTRFQLGLIVVTILFVGAMAANCQSIPAIHFTNVRITTAIENFARMANINYLVDPKLFAPPTGSNANGMPEPSLTLNWTNINLSANDALARVLKENGLVMVQDKFTTVAFITGSNHVANVVDASLLVSTNAATQITIALVPVFRFDMAPLDVALKNLIEHDQLNVVLDPKVSDYVDPNDPTVNKFHNAPMVSFHWENLTAKQTLVALCEAYNLVIVKDVTTGVVSIKPRD